MVNHLEDRVENNNLLFYNFNAYQQKDSGSAEDSIGQPRVRDYSGTVINRHEDASSNYEAAPEIQNTQGMRPYSRGSVRSRQDYR